MFVFWLAISKTVRRVAVPRLIVALVTTSTIPVELSWATWNSSATIVLFRPRWSVPLVSLEPKDVADPEPLGGDRVGGGEGEGAGGGAGGRRADLEVLEGGVERGEAGEVGDGGGRPGRGAADVDVGEGPLQDECAVAERGRGGLALVEVEVEVAGDGEGVAGEVGGVVFADEVVVGEAGDGAVDVEDAGDVAGEGGGAGGGEGGGVGGGGAAAVAPVAAGGPGTACGAVQETVAAEAVLAVRRVQTNSASARRVENAGHFPLPSLPRCVIWNLDYPRPCSPTFERRVAGPGESNFTGWVLGCNRKEGCNFGAGEPTERVPWALWGFG